MSEISDKFCPCTLFLCHVYKACYWRQMMCKNLVSNFKSKCPLHAVWCRNAKWNQSSFSTQILLQLLFLPVIVLSFNSAFAISLLHHLILWSNLWSQVQEYMKRTEQIKAVLRPCSAASAVKNSAMEENMCSNDQAAFQRLNSTSSVESHTVESSPAPTFGQKILLSSVPPSPDLLQSCYVTWNADQSVSSTEELWEDNDEILDASKQISIGRIKVRLVQSSLKYSATFDSVLFE